MERVLVTDPKTKETYTKKRYRCPVCMRGLLGPSGFCPVHLDVKPVDLLGATEKQIEQALFYSKG
ncbi:MAG: hypothetical protein ACOC5T_07080 [Elusimicrobiota bacterium]